MRKPMMLLVAAAVAGATLCGPAAAQDGATLYAKKTCIACHGAEGRKPILPTYPKLAGQNDQYMLAQMKDIKSGARNNGQTAAMKGVMHLVSDEEMAVISTWLSGLQP